MSDHLDAFLGGWRRGDAEMILRAVAHDFVDDRAVPGVDGDKLAADRATTKRRACLFLCTTVSRCVVAVALAASAMTAIATGRRGFSSVAP